jgi:hypothetical protein
MIDKLPPWVTPLLRFGATALIAFYLVYSNQEMMKTLVNKSVPAMTKIIETSEGIASTLKDHEEGANRSRDGQLRMLRVICRNTATDIIQRTNCDNN